MTDWSQVVQLYDQLLAIQPSPVVELNRAVAVAELDGPEVALSIVERLDLASYHPWHVARAELLRRLGRVEESRAAYDEALALTANDAERAHLARRRASL
jgi:RNA polymerase sigma-70 factor (ECF subfamily)